MAQNYGLYKGDSWENTVMCRDRIVKTVDNGVSGKLHQATFYVHMQRTGYYNYQKYVLV